MGGDSYWRGLRGEVILERAGGGSGILERAEGGRHTGEGRGPSYWRGLVGGDSHWRGLRGERHTGEG